MDIKTINRAVIEHVTELVVLVALMGVGLALVGAGLLAGSVALTVPGLFLAGLGIGTWDVAMNVEGADVERQLGRSIMPRLHAGFSLGTALEDVPDHEHQVVSPDPAIAPRRPTREQLQHIQGWGADLDRKNRPGVPMERTPPRFINAAGRFRWRRRAPSV